MALRTRQKKRTRDALLTAAAHLMADGKTPTIEQAAEEAGVSRATAYRYFSNQESMLAEAPLADMTATPEDFLAELDSQAVEERVGRLHSYLLDLTARNEAQFRNMLRINMQEFLDASSNEKRPPRRGPRRLELIRRALEPARANMTKRQFDTLTMALAPLLGLEAWIVMRDVCGLERKDSERILGWAICHVLTGALAESEAGGPANIRDGRDGAGDSDHDAVGGSS